jgi:hypothetical protein
MILFDFPAEIRLRIYSELLVLPEPVLFVADYGSPSPLFLSSRYNLCPAILRVNKKVHSEASPLLYSNNCFQFPDIFTRVPAGIGTYGAHMSPFLKEIGSQTSLIRRIRINFPTFEDYGRGTAKLHESRVKNLKLIRETCTNINTLELLFSNSCPLNFADGAPDDALDLLNAQLKTISPLKKIVIKAEVFDYDDLSDDLEKKMRDCGWIVEVTKLEVPKHLWADDERGIEFDNEEDYIEYMNERHRLDLERGGGRAVVG